MNTVEKVPGALGYAVYSLLHRNSSVTVQAKQAFDAKATPMKAVSYPKPRLTQKHSSTSDQKSSRNAYLGHIEILRPENVFNGTRSAQHSVLDTNTRLELCHDRFHTSPEGSEGA